MGPTAEELAAITSAFGIDPAADVTLLREGTNFVYSIPACGRVLRVHRGGRQQVEDNLRLIRSLGPSDAILLPASWEVAVARQGQLCATLWPLGEPAGEQDAAGFGQALRGLHQLVPPPGLGRVTLLEPVPGRLRRIEALAVDNDIVSFLWDMFTTLEPQVGQVERSGSALLHSDAHLGNAVRYQGVVRLIDLDDLCVGPWQVDFIPAFVAARRMGQQARYVEVLGQTREAFEQWEFLDVATAARELSMVCWLGAFCDTSPGHMQEFLRRANSLIQGRDDVIWSAV